MQLHLGFYDYYRKQNQDVPATWDSDELINPHLLICGKSGTGKSTLLRNLIKQASTAAHLERIHVFDVHGDLSIEGASEIAFNGATRYGYNPLSLDPSPVTGGVRRQTSFLIGVLAQTARKLMDRQEACLRNLITDVYALNGIYEEKPDTWRRKEISDDVRKDIISRREYAALREYYPTLDDLIGLAERKLKAMYGGFDAHASGSKAITALEEMNRAGQAMRKQAPNVHANSDDTSNRFSRAKTRFLESAEAYAGALESGREFDDLIKYDSKETLKSVIDRLKNLHAIGIFSSNFPPFDPGRKVWIYKLNNLLPEEKVIFCCLRAQVIFRTRLIRGVSDCVREIVVSDESHLLFTSDSENVFNLIALEARKFGLALWSASQSPSHFPEQIITTVATKVLLGIDSYYWGATCKKLNINESVLRFIQPHKTIAVSFDRRGSLQTKFAGVQLEGKTPDHLDKKSAHSR